MSNIPFRVVKGTERAILEKEFKEGYIYFATDTRRIYMDTIANGEQQNKVSMGGSGNSGIYYANKTFEDSSDLKFTLADLNSDELPKEDDLIINYGSNNELRDGFYRVNNVQADYVETNFLSVGGGGSGSSGSGKILITPTTPSYGITTLEKGYVIQYSVEAFDNNDYPVENRTGVASYIVNGSTVAETQIVSHKGNYEFDASKYLSAARETNTITVKINWNINGNVDTVQVYTWAVKCVNLQLIWDREYSSDNYITNDSFNLSWTIRGGVDCTTYILIDDDYDTEGYFYQISVPASQSEMNTQLPKFPHGAHKFTMWVSTKLGDEILETDKINKMITFIDETSLIPILTVPFFTSKVTQYTTLNIPYLVYVPNASGTILEFYVDDDLLFTEEIDLTQAQKEPFNWLYTPGRSGEFVLKIGVQGTTIIEELPIQVSPLNLGIEEPKAAFSLKASDISSNAQLQTLIAEGKIAVSEGFDWVNGGLQFEIDEKTKSVSNYICVKRGDSLTLNYQLFNNKATDGKMFKFCFKTVNCSNYNAQVLECKDQNANASTLELLYTAQEAKFSTAAERNFKTQYCENSYIELEAEIWPYQSKDNGDNFLMFWVDGVPAGVQTYNSSVSFLQNIPGNIIIGSAECDVYVYVAKIYEFKLTRDQHLNTFILDAPNAQEISSRFNRNDIINKATGQISYEKLVEKNPGCYAYVYETTEAGFTQEKGDVKSCTYKEYCKDPNVPVLVADNATMEVQGTSSSAYGTAAFNLRTNLKPENTSVITDGKGNIIDGKKVSDTSIPIDYICTKVNVASCENANNALNQEWYNRFQPYWDKHRAQSTATEQYRDCMEFDFGVVFVKDNNDKIDFTSESNYVKTNVFGYNTDGVRDEEYVDNPYYKQYAIGNAGNDKKNRKVFHDVNNLQACCVEVLDNQKEQHEMTAKVTLEDFVDFGADPKNGFYEFRFSADNYKKKEELSKDEITDYKTAQAEAFLRLVNWMADNNPNNATNMVLEKPVNFEPYTFKGFAGNNNPRANAVSLEGLTISRFATKNVYEYIEKTGVTSKNFHTMPALFTEKYELKKNDDGEDIAVYTGIYEPITSFSEDPNVKYYTKELQAEKPYTTDSFNYRMAKMLSECEEYLVMESIIYHYLFIQRHTMVDNVAKNTFWSTEDLQHWDLTKNYDNDTADGNDNSGYLNYGYGLEVGDGIFNAPGSVWLNFIKNLDEAQEYLYDKLQSYDVQGFTVWDDAAYLQLFKDKQSLIPERCWVEDYFRKYIRPRRLGLDGSNKFLQRLEGGKKTHQRKQYETYQRYYIDSKYCSGTDFAETGSFDMRLNEDSSGNWDTEGTFDISYYIDLYPSAKIGGQLHRGPRIKANTEYPLPVGSLIDSPKDATCYIFANSMIQSIDGIAQTYPSYLAIDGAQKLRNIEVGSNDPNYHNYYLRRAKLDKNTQLETAQLREVGLEEGIEGLDLSELKMLQELDLKGSTFTSLALADGCVIKDLWLNETLNTLTLINLSQLKTFNYDINIITNLKNVIVQNCVEELNNFTYELAKANNLEKYCFNNITWNVIGINEKEFKYVDAKWSIQALDNLMNGKGFLQVATQALALTGTVIVDLKDVAEPVNEFQIYEKYIKQFPNLKIEFINTSNNFIPAKTITFKTEYAENMVDIKDFYTIKTDGTKTIQELVSKETSPIGIDIGVPVKDSDERYHYEWSGVWQTNTKIFDDKDMVDQVITNDSDYKPVANLIFGALYDKKERTYTITLKDYNETKKESGLKYGAIYDLPIYKYQPYITDTGVNDNYRYEFQGWISVEDYLSGNTNPDTYKSITITKDTTYYAYYELKANTVASRMEYFKFNKSDNSISLQDDYRYEIQEPIVLPVIHPIDGYALKVIKDFGVYNGNKDNLQIVKIPAIYFEENGKNSQYTDIATGAFCGWPGGNLVPYDISFTQDNCPMQLQKFVLPSSITTIGNSAFVNCLNLTDMQIPEDSQVIKIDLYAFSQTNKFNITGKFFPNVQKILTSAFYQAGSQLELSELPSSLNEIGAWAFADCGNVCPADFSGVQKMGENAFNGSNSYKQITLKLPDDVSAYDKQTYDDSGKLTGSGCFKNYSRGKIIGLTWSGKDTDTEQTLARMEIDMSNLNTIEQVIE